MKYRILLTLWLLPISALGMEAPAQNPFELLPDEIKLPIIQFIATGNTIEEVVRNIRAFAATNREFRQLASDPKLTEAIIKQLVAKFPQETNNDPVFAAAILDTPGAKEWLTKNHPNWLESLNTYAFGMIFRAGSPNNKWDVLSSLLENKQILDGVYIRIPDVLVHLGRSSDAKVAQIARKLLEKRKIDPNQTGGFGFTPLMRAAYVGNLDLVNLLLEFDAKPNLKNVHGETALMLAAINNSIDAVKLLLEHGANPNLHGPNEYTAADLAHQEGNEEIVKILEQAMKQYKERYGL